MDIFAIVIYPLGILGWLYLWHALVGYARLRQKPLLWISFFGALIVLTVNIILGFLSTVPNHSTELEIYRFVETNATTVSEFTLAIAIFVVITFDKEVQVLGAETARRFTSLVLWAFLFAVVGCLPLYWMPPKEGWLTVLRHIKTVPFTYSLFILAAAMIVFLYEVRSPRKED